MLGLQIFCQTKQNNMAAAYSDVPSLAKWQQDSSVAFAIRSQDVILQHIDSLIRVYDMCRDEPPGLVVACDLLFSLDYWLKSYPKNPVLHKGRAPHIRALHACVALKLCDSLGCTINTLPRELELMFGRELSTDGVKVDVLGSTGSKALYMKRSELPLFRLKFKSGKAYQFKWWTRPAGGLTLANSSRAYSPGVGAGAAGQNYGYFVMSMGREIYMMRHGPIPGTDYRIFHSTYLAGDATMAAGSMLIENGVVKRIRPDSGHYKPTGSNMLALLQTLRMVGVPLDRIVMETFVGVEVGFATEFFRHNANWDRLLNQRDSTLQDNKLAFALRSKPVAPTASVTTPKPAPASPPPKTNYV